MNNFRIWLGLIIVCLGLLWPNLSELNILPQEPSVRTVLNMEKPELELIAELEAIDNVNDPLDRDRMSIFAYEFAKRAPGYNIESQTLLDMYGQAAKDSFGDSVKGKYDKNLLGSDAIRAIIGNKESFLDKETTEELSKRFSGTAWVLGDE